MTTAQRVRALLMRAQSISICIPGLPEMDDVAPLLMELKQAPVLHTHQHHAHALVSKPAQLLPKAEQG